MIGRRAPFLEGVSSICHDHAHRDRPLAPQHSRRKRAAATVDRALRGGILGAAVAAVAWVLAGTLAATVFLVLVVATVAAAAFTVMKENAPLGLWAALGVGWLVVMMERWAVQGHGGLSVAAAAWLGIVIGARRAGISKWSLPLLAYPVLCGVIVGSRGPGPRRAVGQLVAVGGRPVLGPVIGARTLVQDRPPKQPATRRRSPQVCSGSARKYVRRLAACVLAGGAASSTQAGGPAVPTGVCQASAPWAACGASSWSKTITGRTSTEP